MNQFLDIMLSFVYLNKYQVQQYHIHQKAAQLSSLLKILHFLNVRAEVLEVQYILEMQASLPKKEFAITDQKHHGVVYFATLLFLKFIKITFLILQFLFLSRHTEWTL